MLYYCRVDFDTQFDYLRGMRLHTHPWEMLYLNFYESGIPYPDISFGARALRLSTLHLCHYSVVYYFYNPTLSTNGVRFGPTRHLFSACSIQIRRTNNI